MSSVSSGWNAATRIRPSRASTGWPSTSASTSTSGPGLLDPRRADEDAAHRLVAVADVEVGLEARTWRPNAFRSTRKSASPRWSRSRTIIPAHVPKIGAVERAQRLVEPVEAHQPRDRGRLAAGQDQAVEAVELLRQPHLDRLRAEAPQHGRVLAEVALHGEHADSKRLLHGAIVECGYSARRRATGEAEQDEQEAEAREGDRRRPAAIDGTETPKPERRRSRPSLAHAIEVMRGRAEEAERRRARPSSSASSCTRSTTYTSAATAISAQSRVARVPPVEEAPPISSAADEVEPERRRRAGSTPPATRYASPTKSVTTAVQLPPLEIEVGDEEPADDAPRST